MKDERDLKSAGASRLPQCALSYSRVVIDRIIPKLRRGQKRGRLELTGDDCEKLLFVLRTSIPLEPFLTNFVEVMHMTFDDHYCCHSNKEEKSDE